MAKSTIDLDAIVIASPCTVPWESMTGDDVKRFCGQCRLHVHDLSQMTRKQALALLQETNGECCKRVWRRPDGRVITKDCQRALAAVRRRVRVLASAVAGLFALVGLGGCGGRRAADDRAGAAPKPSTPAPAAAVKPPEPGATVTTGR